MAGEAKSKVAYGDESVRMALAPPRYLLAATVVEDGAGAAAALAALKGKGDAKLHWRDMTPKQRACSLRAIADLGQETYLAEYFPVARRKQERARRKCLEQLLLRLESEGVGLLVLESRTDRQNKKDLEYLLCLRAQGCALGIEIEHLHGSRDPLLWLPDQVLGAYGDSLGQSGIAKGDVEARDAVVSRIKVLRAGRP